MTHSLGIARPRALPQVAEDSCGDLLNEALSFKLRKQALLELAALGNARSAEEQAEQKAIFARLAQVTRDPPQAHAAGRAPAPGQIGRAHV